MDFNFITDKAIFINEQDAVLAECQYDIEYKFKRTLSTAENKFASYYFTISKPEFDRLGYKLQDGKVVVPTGPAYVLDEKIMRIEVIRVKKDKVATGLGSKMMRRIEDVARANGCRQIYSKFAPHEEDGTEGFPFYLDQGFKVEKRDGVKFVVKHLDGKNTTPPSKV